MLLKAGYVDIFLYGTAPRGVGASTSQACKSFAFGIMAASVLSAYTLSESLTWSEQNTYAASFEPVGLEFASSFSDRKRPSNYLDSITLLSKM